jgi:hypothetical protein
MKRAAFLGFFLLILATGSAMADIINVNPPQITNSWAQGWSENGILQGIIQPYDTIIITTTVGEMEFVTISTPGWSVSPPNPTTPTITSMQYGGSPTVSFTGQFDFVTTFEGTWDNPVSFTYEVFYGGDPNPLSIQIANWDPATMTWTFEYPQNCVRPVPEASFELLLLVGIAFIGMLAVFTKA